MEDLIKQYRRLKRIFQDLIRLYLVQKTHIPIPSGGGRKPFEVDSLLLQDFVVLPAHLLLVVGYSVKTCTP